MKKRVSKIAALISVAFTQSNAEAISFKNVDLSSYNLQVYKSDLNQITPVYLAGHSSHASHGSHGSHRSSAGTYTPSTPVYKKPAPVYKKPAPVYKKPAPVYKKPAPVYKKPAPVYTKPITDRWKSDPLGQAAKPKTSFPPPSKTVTEKCRDGLLGKRKEVVKKVQMYLFLSGHYTNDSKKLFSGVIDSETRNAVNKFKKDNRITGKRNTILDSVTLNTMGIACD